MYWPRLRLTIQESKRWCVYYEPNLMQRAAEYKVYPGVLNFNASNREDVENIACARRAKVFAMTVSGDVHNTEIQLYDSSGEQYTNTFVPVANMFMGLNVDIRTLATFSADPIVGAEVPEQLNAGMVFGGAFCLAPKIFEPAILLDANQTLHVRGRPLQTITAPEAVHLSFSFHVWEFPVE